MKQINVRSTAAVATALLALAGCSDATAGKPRPAGPVLDDRPSEGSLSKVTGKEFQRPYALRADDRPPRWRAFDGIDCWYHIGTDADQLRPMAIVFLHETGTSLDSVTKALEADTATELEGADEANGHKRVVFTIDDRVVSTSHSDGPDIAVTMAKVVLGTA